MALLKMVLRLGTDSESTSCSMMMNSWTERIQLSSNLLIVEKGEFVESDM